MAGFGRRSPHKGVSDSVPSIALLTPSGQTSLGKPPFVRPRATGRRRRGRYRIVLFGGEFSTLLCCIARRTKRSRSRLFSDALKEYLERHTPDEITEAMNKVCAELGETRDGFLASAARRTLKRSEW